MIPRFLPYSFHQIFLYLFCALFILISWSVKSSIRYVTPSGAGLQNGSSWLHAFPANALQNAINLSLVGDEVWVACGNYVTTNTSNRSISFSMRNGVRIYGSFQGTESTLQQREFSCGPCSTLSGEIGFNGIADNSFHVISNVNLNETAWLDGFIIEGGNDNRAATIANGLGGGMYNNGGYSGGVCSPTIQHCIFRNNRAVFGGGIFNSGHSGGNANPIIRDCVITNNVATDGGGGIDNFGLGGNASPSIINCIISDNTALTAGGMYCWGGNANGNSSPQLLNCVIVNNTATNGNAGGIIADNANSGGGNSGTSNPTLRNCILWGNTASLLGPQFFNKGSATFTATYSIINLQAQNFPHVIAGSGDGNIFTNPQFVSITNAIGIDNCWLTPDDGLRLQVSSSGINSGSNMALPVTDIAFGNRMVNQYVDIGAYEYHSGLSTRLFLQGYYIANGFMSPVLLNQQILSNMDSSITDSIDVEVYATSNLTNRITISRSALSTNGNMKVTFPPLAGNYFIKVIHRNTISSWSAQPISLGAVPTVNNFSSNVSSVFGMNQVALGNNVWAFYSGDVNQDENIDITDFALVEMAIQNFSYGYQVADLNGDGNVDLDDVPILENNINAFIYSQHP